MEGFIGNACEKLNCEKKCSGHGECQTLSNYAKLFRDGYSQKYTYDSVWDSNKLMGCICDEGYTGYDCSQRVCPLGDDPLKNHLNLKNGIAEETQDEIQLIRCLANQGGFTLYYKKYSTNFFHYSASQSDIENELRKIPSLEQVIVTFSIQGASACVIQGNGQAELTDDGSSSSTSQGLGNVISIQFRRVYGQIPPIYSTIDSTMKSSGGYVEVNYATSDSVKTWIDALGVTYKPRKTLKESLICSGKGDCDYNTGTCKCYEGTGSGFARGVGYTSSDGYGKLGNIPDCGYIYTIRDYTGQEYLPSCPGDGGVTCSGHGICDTETAKCHCTEGFEGGDCSSRSCPKGYSWYDYPESNEVAHKQLVTCSNMGLCDSTSGECQCRTGFYGNACQYMRSSPTNIAEPKVSTSSSTVANKESYAQNFLRSRFVGDKRDYTETNKKSNKKILPCSGHGVSLSLRQLALASTRQRRRNIDIEDGLFDDDIIVSNQGVPNGIVQVDESHKHEISLLNDFKNIIYGDDPNNTDTWDSNRIYGCLCDPGYFGYDCSLKKCPSGDDRTTTEDRSEVQLLRCLASPVSSSDTGFYLQYGEVRSSLIPASITAEQLEKHIDLLLYKYDFLSNEGRGNKLLRWQLGGQTMGISRENPFYLFENSRRSEENKANTFENSHLSSLSSADVHSRLDDGRLATDPSSVSHAETDHSDSQDLIDKLPVGLLSLSSLVSSSDSYNNDNTHRLNRAYPQAQPQRRVKVTFVQDLPQEYLDSEVFPSKESTIYNKFQSGTIQLPPWLEIDTVNEELKYSSTFDYNTRYSSFFTPPESSSSLCSPDGYQFAIIEFTSHQGSILPLNIINNNLEIDQTLQNDIFNADGSTLTSYIDSLNNSPVLGLFSKGENVHQFNSLIGTTENVECNNHGICDYSVGECKCFKGWTSGDGRRQGGEGIEGDCGYRVDDITLDKFPI